MGGILIDQKRMNRILEIDEDNMTATVEPYVSMAQLSTELQKRSMFISVPGAPSTVTVISNYVWGCGKGRVHRVGAAENFIIGFEMVLPDGTIVEINYDRVTGKAFWPYGPGPDLHMFPHSVAGSYGIVTKMTVKCWPGEREQEKTEIITIAFNDLVPGVKFAIEVSRREILHDFLLYGGPIYSCYATDTAESQHRVNRFQPSLEAICLLNGSERRRRYQEKVIRELAKKYGGRIIADVLPPYKDFDDAHLAMSSSYFSDTTMKYYSLRANIHTHYQNIGFGSAPQERFIEGIKTYLKYMMDDPDLGDLSFGHDPTFWYWFMASFGGGGHSGGRSELHIALHAGDPRSQEAFLRFRHGIERAIENARVGVAHSAPASLSRWGIDEERVGRDTYYRAAKRLKMLLDPECLFAPGYIFIY
jgi:FAD/FMN-containing dehydrogenase